MPDYADELFSDEQVATAISKLSGWDRFEDVASLASGEYGPTVITAFSNLAVQLKLPVTVQGGSLIVRRQRPPEELRSHALRNLRYAAERGEITPALLDKQDDDEH